MSRPVWAGICKWTELLDGSLTIKDLLDMHRSLNLRDHLEKLAYEQERKKGGGHEY